MILLYGLAVDRLGRRIVADFEKLGADRFSLVPSVVLLTDVLTVVGLVLVIVIFFVRRLPVARGGGNGTWLVAIVASNFELLVVALPRATSSPARELAAAALLTVGLAAGIYVLSVLGRSFSILPQARGLVTRGPYRVVRHPLYLAGMIAALGIMLRYEQPWAAFITGAGF